MLTPELVPLDVPLEVPVVAPAELDPGFAYALAIISASVELFWLSWLAAAALAFAPSWPSLPISPCSAASPVVPLLPNPRDARNFVIRAPRPAEVLLIWSAPAVSVACVAGESVPLASDGARL
jgi:hypothetical protein